MDNMINVNMMSGAFNRYVRSTISRETGTTATNAFAEAVEDAASTQTTEQCRPKRSGGIEDSLRKHPDWRPIVEQHIAGGDAVKAAYPPSNATADMTMAEYKSYIQELIDTIPVDASHWKDDMCFNISDEGFETMKDDPQYESWVLGQIRANLTFHNPWASAPGWTGSVFIDNFGSCIEEHHGTGIGKSSPAAKGLFDKGSKDSFWSRRSKAKEEADEQAEKVRAKREQQKELLDAAASQKRLQQRMLTEYYINLKMQRSSDESDGSYVSVMPGTIPASMVMPSPAALALAPSASDRGIAGGAK